MLKNGKRLFLILAIFCGLLTLVSCNTTNALRITLDSEKYELKIGETLEVSAEVTKDGVVTDASLGYKSFDESIATFVGGKLTGVSEGTTKIKVYSLQNPLYDVVATVTVSFSQSLQADFRYSYTMLKGDTQKINYTLALDSQDAVVSYKSTDESILSVDQEGNVLGLGWGVAQVIARVSNVNDPKQYREFALEITVDGAKYSINYDLAGGNCDTELPNSYVEGTTVTLPNASKEGYNFVGWLNGYNTINEVTPDMASDLELVAQWEIIVYELSFEANGGLVTNVPTTYTVEDEFTLPTPTKVGYNFVGWYDNSELEGEAVRVLTKGNTGDKTYYAKYELVLYNVTFELNDGSFDENILTIADFADIFVADFNAAAGSSVSKTTFYSETITPIKTAVSNEEFYDKYQWLFAFAYECLTQANDGFTSAYYTDTVAFLEALMQDYESAKAMVNNAAAPGPNGRTCFRVWLEGLLNETLSKVNTAYTPYCTDFSLKENQTKFWNVYQNTEREYTIFDTLPVAYKEGYTFLGWYEGETKVEAVNQNCTLVAQWEVVSYKVNYDLAGGVWGEEQGATEFKYNEFVKLVTPVKEGAIFAGWMQDGEYVTEINKNQNYNLVATWTNYSDLKYTISYDLAGGVWGEQEGVTEFAYNEHIDLVAPVKEGYNFLGWYSDGTLVTSIANQNYVLQAKWEEIVNSDDSVTLVVNPADENAYQTLEDAQAAAKSGDTIQLVAGTYTTATITVSNLTIVGPNAGINPNTTTRNAEAVFTGDLVIAADNVKVDGIQFTGAGRLMGSQTVSFKDLTVLNVLVKGGTISSSTNAVLYFLPSITSVTYSNIYIANMRLEAIDGRAMIMYGTKINGLTVINSEFFGTSSSVAQYNDGLKLYIGKIDDNNVFDYDVKGEVTISSNKFVNYLQYPVWFGKYGDGIYTLENNTFDNSAVYTSYNDGCFTFANYALTETSSKVLINVSYNTANNSGILARIQAAGLDSTTLEAHVNYNKIYGCLHTIFVGDNGNNSGNYIDAKYNYYDVTPTTSNFSGVSAWEPYYTDESQVPTYGKEVIYYGIKYTLNGGKFTSAYPTEYESSTGLSVLPTPEKEGYTFEGWYLNGKLVTSIKAGTEGDVTLVASWKEVALYVGEGYYATITEALAAAKEGDKIIILAGTYDESFTVSIANLTIAGPNENVNPNTETREAEAVLTGTITISSSASNLKITGLAFTESAKIKGSQVYNLTFKNNYIYNTEKSSNTWAEGNTYRYGFILFSATSATPSKNLQFFNNKFENVSECNITIVSVNNISLEGNVFKNFERDAIRFDGGANDGVISITNNEFVQDSLGGYNGIYFRIYGSYTKGVDAQVVISNNKFVNIGNADAGLYSGAIGARNYNEYGTSFSITNNYFEKCYNYIRLRNNATAANHAAYKWECSINNNQFIGLPTSYYYAQWNNSDSDTSQNPLLAVFGANYYEDNDGKVITDLANYESYFKQVANKGTALSSKPDETTATPFEIYTIEYDLDGGEAKGTFVTSYNSLNNQAIAIPTPTKANHNFLGWNLNGNLVTEIPADSRGDLVLVAEFELLEGDFYNVTFVDSLGTWPSRDALDQYEIAELLLADIYEWQTKYCGETASYDSWESPFVSALLAGTNKNLRNVTIGAFPDEEGNTTYFLNIPEYYEKWMDFFRILDEAIQKVNPDQGLWKDAYAAHMRVGQFLNWSKPSYYSSYLARMCEAVRVPEEVMSQYQGGQYVKLPVLTNKLGLEFLGWYDNPEFTGDAIEAILTTDSGDKVFYSKWENETIAEKVELNVIDQIKRYSTYQLVWSFLPLDTTNKSVEFFSSDPSIATVGLSSGLITGVNNGTVTITMKVYGNRKLDVTFELTVYSPEHIEGSYDTESLVVKNETIKLNAVNSGNANATIKWSSSNPDIAYVDATSGVVTGVKAGLATITASSTNSNGETITLDFVVTVIDEALTGVLEFVASNNNANIFTRYGLSIGGSYDADIFGSVSKLLYNKKLTIDTKYLATAEANGTYNKNEIKNGSLEFITVHYTGNMNSTADTDNNASYFASSKDVSIHYVTGNEGKYSDGTPSSTVYQTLSHDHGAYHAGDSGARTHSGEFAWYPTGVAYDNCDLLKVEFTASDDFYFEINGKKTTIKLPTTWNYEKNGIYRNTDHIYNADGTISSQSDYTGLVFTNRTPESFFNDQGFPIKVVDGEYYMGTTWWSYTQVHEGRICGSGGNRNSIGIESCVNEGSDLWYTWQITAQLVAKLMLDNNLDISRVKGHHFFDGKDCPQPLLENDLEIWWEFIDLVKAEHKLISIYSDYEITFVSNNPEIINDYGRVVAEPEYATCVTYTVTVKDSSGNTQTITLASMVPGIYEK